MSLDLRWIRAFTTVVRRGSFVAAADALHLSQPALGLQVRKLEQRLGVHLLERHARGARMTSAGKAFLPHAEGILQRVSDAEQAMRQHAGRRSRKLTIGATPAAARTFGPPIMTACAADLGLELSIRSMMTEPALRQLNEGKLDLALCYRPAPDAGLAMPLFREAFCLVGPPDLLPDGDDIAFRALADYRLILDPQVREMVERAGQGRAVPLTIVAEVEPNGITLDLLTRSGCCTILSRGLLADQTAAGELRCLTIRDPALPRTLFLSAHADTAAADVDLLLQVITAFVEQEIASGQRGWFALEGGETPARPPVPAGGTT